jgi:plasmid stabilization system protein ParE
VPTLVCSPRFLAELARAHARLREQDSPSAQVMANAITTGLEALELNPLIGRRIDGNLRELAISCGETGLVALYRFIIPRDEVRVLVLCRQRDLGFRP